MKKRILASMLSLLLLLLPLSACATDKDTLFITVLDVGQGDCLLLSCAGEHLLIDTGSAVSRDRLLGELSRLGITDLDAILVTHPHEDHYGNVGMLLETRTVGALFLAERPGEELGYELMLARAMACGVETKTLTDGTTFSFNGVICEAFCPIPDDPDLNNAGIVLRVRYGESVLLFMGDAEWTAERALLSRNEDWKCDFLKVGHHGSKTACSELFLQAVAPTVAAISCAVDNDYGFPHEEVLQGLDQIGAAVYRTDERGTLRFICDGTRVVYEE